MAENLATLRSRAEHAYARWRACDAQRPRDAAADEECARLKHELDLAEEAVRVARTQAFDPSPLTPGDAA